MCQPRSAPFRWLRCERSEPRREPRNSVIAGLLLLGLGLGATGVGLLDRLLLGVGHLGARPLGVRVWGGPPALAGDAETDQGRGTGGGTVVGEAVGEPGEHALGLTPGDDPGTP